MPRIERGLVDNCIYHLLNRGNGGQKVFLKEYDYKAFIELMKEAQTKHPIKLFGYCLMPNHFHMLIKTIHAEELSMHMQWLMTSHVRRYHKHYGTSGHVWQGRFKSFIIQEDVHFLTVLRYVLRNPVRKGLAKSARDWKWASLKDASYGDSNGLLHKLPIELPQDWEQYVDRALTEQELVEVRKSVNRCSPYGESTWQRQIAKELGLESTLRPRGRPSLNSGSEDE